MKDKGLILIVFITVLMAYNDGGKHPHIQDRNQKFERSFERRQQYRERKQPDIFRRQEHQDNLYRWKKNNPISGRVA